MKYLQGATVNLNMNEVKEGGMSLLILRREFQKQVTARAKVLSQRRCGWSAMVECLSKDLRP